MNVMIFSDEGDQVWAKHRGGVIPASAATSELAPGEELRFKAYWDVTDQDGFALTAGRYVVRATSDIHDFVDDRARLMNLATGLHELVVAPAEGTAAG